MILTLLLFIFILGLVVFIHESGHFLFAKLSGVHIYEFSLGFGPVILKKKAKDQTQYSIRAIPLGGFVSMAGEEVDYDKNKHRGKNMQDKTFLQRLLIMFMGVGFNFIFAFLIFLLIGFFYGPVSLKPVISDVTANYPASLSGIEKGDTVLKIDNHKVTYLDDISLYLTLGNLEDKVTFEVKKIDGSIKTYNIKPLKQTSDDGKASYVIGIGLSKTKEQGFLKVFKYAFLQECALFKQMFKVLGALFTGKLSINSLSGPIGIYGVVGQYQKQGMQAILYLISLLSINVGIINLIPLPAFDGGRIIFLIIEKIKGSPINPKVENTIHSIGFILLMILMVYITFNDILKLF